MSSDQALTVARPRWSQQRIWSRKRMHSVVGRIRLPHARRACSGPCSACLGARGAGSASASRIFLGSPRRCPASSEASFLCVQSDHLSGREEPVLYLYSSRYTRGVKSRRLLARWSLQPAFGPLPAPDMTKIGSSQL